MDFDFSFLEAKGIDVCSGIEFTGNEVKYVAALKRYFESFETSENKTCEFFEKEDFSGYNIMVHALKSNSKMIGAKSLAKEFEKLEVASREGDIEYIRENHLNTIDAYRDLTELLRPIAESDIIFPVEEIDSEKAKEIISHLLEALDDFDDVLSKELALELTGYQFERDLEDELSRAVSLINDFMYDAATEIIKKISATIE